ncbi:hypothetical protein J7643_19535 [bacterium]|nr:hypothetical protein [bacterium]
MAGHSRMRRGLALAVGAVCIGLIGCMVAPNNPGNGNKPKPAPLRTEPFVSKTTTLDFSGSMPAPFEDPTTGDQRFSTRWAAGRWAASNGEFRQQQQVSTATLMMQRYKGDGFGLPDGQAPSKYRLEATAFAYRPVTASGSIIAGAPAGVVAIIPYYLDTTHYIIVERVNNLYEVWFVDGLTPGDEWNAEVYRKYDMMATGSLAVNEPITYKTEIDTKAGTLKLWINDEFQTLIQDPNFIKDVKHGIALVANGNFVAYKDMKLTPLSAE